MKKFNIFLVNSESEYEFAGVVSAKNLNEVFRNTQNFYNEWSPGRRSTMVGDVFEEVGAEYMDVRFHRVEGFGFHTLDFEESCMFIFDNFEDDEQPGTIPTPKTRPRLFIDANGNLITK